MCLSLTTHLCGTAVSSALCALANEGHSGGRLEGRIFVFQNVVLHAVGRDDSGNVCRGNLVTPFGAWREGVWFPDEYTMRKLVLALMWVNAVAD